MTPTALQLRARIILILAALAFAVWGFATNEVHL